MSIYSVGSNAFASPTTHEQMANNAWKLVFNGLTNAALSCPEFRGAIFLVATP